MDIKTQLLCLKEQFIRDRCIFIPGKHMERILLALGAAAADLESLPLISNNLQGDPTLPFRRTKNGRFRYDMGAQPPILRRLEQQPFILSAEEDFVRYDSGQVRHFDEIDDGLQHNSALQALFVFKTFMLRSIKNGFSHRPGLDYNTADFICTLFHIRTVTSPELVGEPALEGVHSDGVDFTMTTFLASSNMTLGSAKTLVHNNREKTGIRFDEINPEYLCGQFQHQSFLDTLLFVDHERKHSLNPVERLDCRHEATRDMLVFFTRKPVENGHVSWKFDSLREHTTKPLAVNLSVVK